MNEEYIIKTSKELADWIEDRIAVGMGEEAGSIDSVMLNNSEVCVVVNEDENGNKTFDVMIDNGAMFSAVYDKDTTINDILSDLDNSDVETWSKEIN